MKPFSLPAIRKHFAICSLVVIGATASISRASAADALFFQQIQPAVEGTGYWDPYVSGFNPNHENAEDVPFTGTQQLSSFKFGYKSNQPVVVRFRFYGVDSFTGMPGTLLASVVRSFEAGEATPLVTLSSSEQFSFAAQPNLAPLKGEFGASPYLDYAPHTGGWMTVTMSAPDGSALPVDGKVSLRNAYASTSALFLLDMTTGAQIQDYGDASIQAGALYLELYSSASSNVPPPALAALITPASVSEYQLTHYPFAHVTPVLNNEPPFGGTTVQLQSSNPSVLSVPPTITITPGRNYADVPLTPVTTVKKPTRVRIQASVNGATTQTYLTVTP